MGRSQIKEGDEYAILTNIIHQEWFDVEVQAHKAMKGLKTQNLRGHMSEAELIPRHWQNYLHATLPSALKPPAWLRMKQQQKTGGNIAKKHRWRWKARRARK